MKFYRGSFKLKDKSVGISDGIREKMLNKNRIAGIAAALFVTVLGVQDIFLAITDYKLPSVAQNIEGLLFVVFLILLLVESFRVSKYNLEPADEFEALADARAKTRAFNFLSTGVLLIIIFINSPNDYIVPILYILLGMSWLIQVEVLKPKNAK